MNSRNCGASPEQWAYLNALGDDVRYIVPIVSNPALPAVGALAQNSRMRGKVPSVKTSRGEAMGLPGWQTHDSAPEKVMRWSRDPDMGYGFRTGHGGIIAIDCDIDDPEICSAVAQMLATTMDINWQDIPRRTHRTARWATLIRVEGIDTQPKHILEWTDGSGNKIEFLGTGQQLACAGRHPSGDWYEWSSAPFPIPVISQDEFKEFISAIRKEWNVSTSKIDISPIRVKGKTILSVDKLADWLRDTGRVLETGQGGELYITCPWEDQHTTETGARATVYFPIGSNGYLGGGFKCLHAHCAGRTLEDFREWAISQGFSEVPAEAYPDESEALEASKAQEDPEVRRVKNILQAHLQEKTGLIDATPLTVSSAISCPEFLGYEFATDLFYGRTVKRRLGEDEWVICKETDILDMRCELEQKGFKPAGLKKELVKDSIDNAASFRTIDSMQMYLSSHIPEWDGTPRAERFFIDHCHAEDSDYSRAVGRYFWGMLWRRAASSEPIKADISVVLIGGQGANKSQTVEKLALSPEFATAINFTDKSDERVRKMAGHVLCEIPELVGMSNKSVSELKEFLSLKTDRIRPLYKNDPIDVTRRCLFVMTTNQRQFLRDATGNRRFAPLEIEKFSAETIEPIVPQLWAEGEEIFKKYGGKKLHEDVEAFTSEKNDEFMIDDPWEDAIEDWVESGASASTPLTSRGILMYALNFNDNTYKATDFARLATVMQKLGFVYGPHRSGGKVRKEWHRSQKRPDPDVPF